MRICFLSLLLLLASCLSENLTPEGALKEFVETRIGSTVTRNFVLERVTGKMKQSFENMSDEDFKKFSDLRNIKQNSFKVLTKSCIENKCYLTYSVGYKTTSDKTSFNSEVKKIAEIHNIEGKWLISDVSNIKTYHESMEPINPLDN